MNINNINPCFVEEEEEEEKKEKRKKNQTHLVDFLVRKKKVPSIDSGEVTCREKYMMMMIGTPPKKIRIATLTVILFLLKGK